MNAIAVIVYYPDEQVINRLIEYVKTGNDLIVFDNTPDKRNPIIAGIASEYLTDVKGNVGMTGALQKIFEISINKNYQFILTMDQDSDFENDKIDSLFEFALRCENRDIAIFCPNNRKKYLNAAHEIYSKTKISTTENAYVNFSMTSGSLMRVECLKKLDLSNLFIGYVDREICYLLLQNGFKILMLGDIIMNQQVGESLRGTFYNRFFRVVNLTPQRYYLMGRNNLYLQKKFKSNKGITRELRRDYIRILLNIILGEKNKIIKLKQFHLGTKQWNCIAGKVEQ